MFEQSILLDPHAKRPWNFLASLSAELVIVSLAVLIPLAYSDHLPAFHWKDIMMRPAPVPLPEHVAPSKNSATTNRPSMAPAQRRIFHYTPESFATPVPAASYSFTPEAPPSIGFEGSPDGILDANRLGTLTIRTQPPPPRPPAHVNTPSAPIRVSGSVQMAKLIRKVIPAYPALARTARISGVVHLIGTIAKDGTIRNLQLVDGHPLLARAAMEAVEQWVYKPTLLNGDPVEVIVPIEVSFTLGP